MKSVYFLSDAHLGSLAIPHQRMQERRLVRFLDSIKEKAGAIYLLGDMFDFWYEYKYVVPKGFTRFLGKLEIYGHEFFLAHGDGMGDPNKSFKLIRAIFHNKLCQWAFSNLHPRWGIGFGLTWAKHSYIKHKETDEPVYLGECCSPRNISRHTRTSTSSSSDIATSNWTSSYRAPQRLKGIRRD